MIIVTATFPLDITHIHPPPILTRPNIGVLGTQEGSLGMEIVEAKQYICITIIQVGDLLDTKRKEE